MEYEMGSCMIYDKKRVFPHSVSLSEGELFPHVISKGPGQRVSIYRGMCFPM